MSHASGRRGVWKGCIAVAGLAAAGLLAGGAVAQATGDFNNDGFDDLAIGAPNEGIDLEAGAGVVHIIFGAGNGLRNQGSQYWHLDKAHVPTPAKAGDRFGESLAVGDFDNDGFDDLAIGIPGKKVGGHDGAGAVLVLRGKNGGLSTHGSSFWTQDVQGLIDAAGDLERFGSALVAADFNGDGFADLAISSPAEGGPGETGAVHILYGSAVGLLVEGNQFFKRGSGESLAAGDFDNDGFADLVIGSPTEEVSGEDAAGLVRVLFGSAEGVTNEDRQTWSQDSEGILGNAEADDQFGSSLAIGDFNNDGFHDLAIGTPRETVAPDINCGTIIVLYGSGSGLRLFGTQTWAQDRDGVLDKQEPSDFFGWSLVAADFNGDGFDDLAIGVPGEKVSREPGAGAVAVLFGSDDRLTADDDELWHQDKGNVLDKCELNDRFGIGVAAGDFNGDGNADLAVSVAFEDVGGVADAGAVAVLYGVPEGLDDLDNQLWHQNKSGIQDECETNDQFGGVS